MSLNDKRQLIIFGNLHWTNILHARNQDKSSFLHVFTINNNTKKMVSQNAACFDQAKFKNTPDIAVVDYIIVIVRGFV